MVIIFPPSDGVGIEILDRVLALPRCGSNILDAEVIYRCISFQFFFRCSYGYDHSAISGSKELLRMNKLT